MCSRWAGPRWVSVSTPSASVFYGFPDDFVASQLALGWLHVVLI